MCTSVKGIGVAGQHALAAAWGVALLVALSACGAGGGGGPQSPGTSPSPPQTASPCPAGATAASAAPGGETQALTVVHVLVTAGVATTPGVLRAGTTSCVSVGVGQTVALTIDARVPPVPAESQGASLLSAITVTPRVATGPGVPAHYVVTFTAEAPGTTTLAYLPATCTLPPGAC